MGKRKFQLGDIAVVNNKVPKHMARYIGHRGEIATVRLTVGPPIMYELRDLLEPFYAQELDRVKK